MNFKLVCIGIFAMNAVACRTTSESASTKAQAGEVGAEVGENTTLTADNCLDGQDLSREDVDISKCPQLPSSPKSVDMPVNGSKVNVRLGMWEQGTATNGATYHISSLQAPSAEGGKWKFGSGNDAPTADKLNIDCWAKGYYRLRKMLQTPSEKYLALRDKRFLTSFYQFQTDLRNGPTGFKQLVTYQNSLVKWVTVITKDGRCIQPTLGRFNAYIDAEYKDRITNSSPEQ